MKTIIIKCNEYEKTIIAESPSEWTNLSIKNIVCGPCYEKLFLRSEYPYKRRKVKNIRICLRIVPWIISWYVNPFLKGIISKIRFHPIMSIITLLIAIGFTCWALSI